MSPKALLLWDGQCGFCRRAVAQLQRRDSQQAFLALPYQEAPSPPMTAELREACARAAHVVTPDGQVLRAGRAVLYVLGRLGHPQLARLLSLPPLVWGVGLGYWLVARHRQLFSRVLFRRA
ncbi:MAG: thiol-disulfide oxidoreductase DCC family protein [Myxococcaceae bacterium]